MIFATLALHLCLQAPTRQEGPQISPARSREQRGALGDFHGPGPLSGINPPREYRVHDYLSVIVRERGSGRSAAELRSDRRARWEAEFNKFIRLDRSNHHDEGGINIPEIRAADLADDPGIDIDARYRNDNLGRTSREFDMQFQVMAEIVEVRPNGVLVVEATKERTINNETETIRLTGEVPPGFIRSDVVDSSDIANLRITYEGVGTVSDNARPGLIGWILQKLWPF